MMSLLGKGISSVTSYFSPTRASVQNNQVEKTEPLSPSTHSVSASSSLHTTLNTSNHENGSALSQGERGTRSALQVNNLE